ncbi:MAG TPA: sigma 54-interacting transcriptional regulator, partial [Methylomirabilota bacterium]|nr:sigma 54-interacting transcriptional regulator [Methylomirabilota bacterium]
RRVDREAHEVAGHDAPVVIRGEMGLGKARLARRIHLSSDRCSAPFVTVDAIGGTDALSLLDRAIAEVGEGTLFVSGIGRLPEEGQARLALALRDGAFRLIATAGLRLEEKAAANGFRHDLLYALRAHEIVIPALADRTEDAVWLATQLFPGLNARRPAPLKGIAASAEAAMRTHDWPGNGREVRSRMVRAVEAADTDMILPSDLFPERAAQESIRPLSEVRDDAERTQIVAALAHTSGQVTEAAKLLRVSRTTLWEKMQKLDL